MTSHVVLDSSHMGNTWDWLEIISWNMTDGELRWWIYTRACPFYQWWISEVIWSILGHTPLIDDSFLWDDPTLGHSRDGENFSLEHSHPIWSFTRGHTPRINDSFLVGWRFTLRHSQFASSLGLWWIRSYGMTLHWGTAIPKSTFIEDTVTPLDILHWDTLHSLMIDFWDDGLFWDTIASDIAHVGT